MRALSTSTQNKPHYALINVIMAVDCDCRLKPSHLQFNFNVVNIYGEVPNEN